MSNGTGGVTLNAVQSVMLAICEVWQALRRHKNINCRVAAHLQEGE